MGTFKSQRGLAASSGGVRATFDPGEGGAVVGQAVAEFALELGSGIKKRSAEREKKRQALIVLDRKNIDTAEKAKAGVSKVDFLRDVDDIKDQNAPDKWADLITQRATQYKSETDILDLSPEERNLLSIDMGGVSRKVEDEAFADKVTRNKVTAIQTAEQSLTALARRGDASQKEISDQWKILRFNGRSAEEIRLSHEAAMKAGKLLRNKDAVDELGNEAVSNPVATIEKVSAEQALRKDGKGEIPEDVLSDQELVSAERVATFRIDEIKRNTEAGVKNEQEQEENKLFVGLDDGSMTIADVVNNPVLDVAAKRRLVTDESKFVDMDLQKSWPLVDNDTAVQDLNTKLTDQSSGLTDINEMNKDINAAAASGRLTKETRDKMRASAKKGGLDAIDEQVNASTLRVKNALTGRLTAREARFKVVELSRELTPDEQRLARSVGFLSQVGFEQLNRFNAELNKRMRETGKETLSGVEVESLSAQVWDKYKKKDDAQKIREFLEFTGKRVPMPDGFSTKVWNELAPRARAEVITSVSNGLTNKQIMEALGK